LVLSDWDSPVLFATVIGCRVEESLGRQKLIIDYKTGGEGEKQTRKVTFKDFTREDITFLDAFQRYYGRHMTARNYQAEKNLPDSNLNSAA